MSKFVKLQMSKPSGVRFINLDCVMAVAVGENNTAKLYMVSGDEYETDCPYEEFLEIIYIDGPVSGGTSDFIGFRPERDNVPLPY